MLYRIDYERFLTHAIDYFTAEEILAMQFIVVGSVATSGRIGNVLKKNDFYPNSEIQNIWIKHQKKDLIKKLYFEHLKKHQYPIYTYIVNNILNHQNVVLIHKDLEGPYLDLFCEFIEKEYDIETINLTELFITGRHGSVYIDMGKIHDSAVDIRRAATMEEKKALESSPSGRLQMLTEMSRKDKLAKLKERGIKVDKRDYKNLDKLLIEDWVEEED